MSCFSLASKPLGAAADAFFETQRLEARTHLHQIVTAIIPSALADAGLARGLMCRIVDRPGRLD